MHAAGTQIEWLNPRELESSAGKYRISLREPSTELIESVRRFGVPVPLPVAGSDPPVLLAEHLRLQTASELGLNRVPILRIMDDGSDIASAWDFIWSSMQTGAFTGLELAYGFYRSIRMTRADPAEFYSRHAGILRPFLPDELIRTGSLPFPFLRRLARMGIDLPKACLLSAFRGPERRRLLALTAIFGHLTLNQLRQLTADLLDLAGRTGDNRSLHSKTVKEIYHAENLSKNQKAARWAEHVHRMRFPEKTAFGERIAVIVRKIDRPPLIAIRTAPGFESDDYELKCLIQSAGDIDELIRILETRKPELIQLLQVFRDKGPDDAPR